MTALSMTSQAFFIFQVQNTWLAWTAIGVTLAIEIYIFCCNGARTYPSNMILLALFTFCEGYIVSFIASATGYQSGNGTVLLAAGLTMGTFWSYHLSRSYCMHSLRLLHRRGLHNIIFGSNRSFGNPAHPVISDNVHRLPLHPQPILRSGCPALFHLSHHRYPTHYGG